MKAERVENSIVATEVAMTLERIQNRIGEAGIEPISAPVAIRQRSTFGNFAEANGFVHGVGNPRLAWVSTPGQP